MNSSCSRTKLSYLSISRSIYVKTYDCSCCYRCQTVFNGGYFRRITDQVVIPENGTLLMQNLAGPK